MENLSRSQQADVVNQLCAGCLHDCSSSKIVNGELTEFSCGSGKGSKPRNAEDLLRKAHQHNPRNPSCPHYYNPQ